VRHGSTAIAGKEVDGCAASGEFQTFDLNRERVVPEWIHWQTKARGFWSKCDALSRGSACKSFASFPWLLI
jgi:type I restriction enzyme, S subunit